MILCRSECTNNYRSEFNFKLSETKLIESFIVRIKQYFNN